MELRERPEEIWTPLYDRVHYPAFGVFDLLFFDVPLGAPATLIRDGCVAGFTKTRRDTNLHEPHRLPAAAKLFKVRGISVCCVPLQPTRATCDDLEAKVSRAGFLELMIENTQCFTVPLNTRGLLIAAPTLPEDDFGPLPASRIIYTIGTVLYLDPYSSFSVRMQFDGSPPFAEPFDICVQLHGFMRRPTQ